MWDQCSITKKKTALIDLLTVFGFIYKLLARRMISLCPMFICQWASFHFGSTPSLDSRLQMCPLFSCCVCVFTLRRPIEKGRLYCHNLATGKPTRCDITDHYGPRLRLCFGAAGLPGTETTGRGLFLFSRRADEPRSI